MFVSSFGHKVPLASLPVATTDQIISILFTKEQIYDCVLLKTRMTDFMNMRFQHRSEESVGQMRQLKYQNDGGKINYIDNVH